MQMKVKTNLMDIKPIPRSNTPIMNPVMNEQAQIPIQMMTNVKILLNAQISVNPV